MTTATPSGPMPTAWARLTALPRARETRPGQWQASCPTDAHLHGDRSAGLAVALGDDGAVLVHCGAGCDVRDILAAVGLRLRDCYPDTPERRQAQRIAARAIAAPVDPYRGALRAAEVAALEHVGAEDARTIATAVVESIARQRDARAQQRDEGVLL